MNKKTRFSLFALLIVTFIFSTAGIAKAEDSRPGDSVGVQTSAITQVKPGAQITIDAKTANEIGVYIKNEMARCASLSTQNQKTSCVKHLEINVRAKFPTVFAAHAEIFKGMMEKMNGGKDDHTIPVKMDGMIGNKEKDENNNKEQRQNFKANFSGRFDVTIKNLEAIYDRISSLADRIESRMAKLSAEGIDVTTAKGNVSTARVELAAAKNSTNTAQISFKAEYAAYTSTNTDQKTSEIKTAFAKTLANIQNAKKHLMAAHENLVKAMGSLKVGIDKKGNTVKVDTSTQVKASTDVKKIQVQ